MKRNHLIDFTDITYKEWQELLDIALDIKKNPDKYLDACRDKILATLFFEPSTRTMFSFQTAMLRLGGKVIGFSEPKNSSVSKGEDLQDTIKTVSCYADIIAMRHPIEGAAMAASLYSDTPIINAGDGGHAHPTQTLTDLTTIMLEKGRLDHLTVGMCGDLKNGRTVHSLVSALSRNSGIHFIFISPEKLRMPPYLLKMLENKGIQYKETEDLESEIPPLDILYMTRIQRERFADMDEYNSLKGIYVLNAHKLSKAKEDMMVMHPLPRVDEISHDVDDDKRAKYFVQANNGLYIRMALLLRMLRREKKPNTKEGFLKLPIHCTNPKCITNTESYLPQLFDEVPKQENLYHCIYCDKQYEWKAEN
jgi:aspartate carbamoyltransferase catalytic subunit